MCMEDVRLGRDLSPAASVVAVAAGAAQTVLQADPMRTRIIFGSNLQDTIFVAPEGVVPSNTQGFPLNSSVPSMTVRVEEWGKLVAGRWQAVTILSPAVLTIVTASLEKQ